MAQSKLDPLKFLADNEFSLPFKIDAGANWFTSPKYGKVPSMDNLILQAVKKAELNCDNGKRGEMIRIVSNADPSKILCTVHNFIWKLWLSRPKLPQDYHLFRNGEDFEKMDELSIRSNLTTEGATALKTFLYYEQLPTDLEATIDVCRHLPSLPLEDSVKEAFSASVHHLSNPEKIIAFWKKKEQAFDLLQNDALVSTTVACILTNPELFFSMEEGWQSIPMSILQLVTPQSLRLDLTKYEQYGANASNIKTYNKDENTYLQLNHTELAHFIFIRGFKLCVEEKKLTIGSITEYDINCATSTVAAMIDQTQLLCSNVRLYPGMTHAGLMSILRMGLVVCNPFHLSPETLMRTKVSITRENAEKAGVKLLSLEREADNINEESGVVISEMETDEKNNDSKRKYQNEGNYHAAKKTCVAITTGSQQLTMKTKQLQKLFDFGCEDDADVEVQLDGKKINLHSFILSIHSNVWEAHFSRIQTTLSLINLAAFPAESSLSFFKSLYAIDNTDMSTENVSMIAAMTLLMQCPFMLHQLMASTSKTLLEDNPVLLYLLESKINDSKTCLRMLHIILPQLKDYLSDCVTFHALATANNFRQIAELADSKFHFEIINIAKKWSDLQDKLSGTKIEFKDRFKDLKLKLDYMRFEKGEMAKCAFDWQIIDIAESYELYAQGKMNRTF